MKIRPETPEEAPAIRRLVEAAFLDAPHASGREGALVDALRAAGALSLSLVAVEMADDGEDWEIGGHIGFSPIRVNGAAGDWYGLAPLSVRAERRRAGWGAALVQEGLTRLRAMGAGGCVVLGDPAYYRRFGFARDPGLTYRGAPEEYFLALPFQPPTPQGEVRWHAAFDAL